MKRRLQRLEVLVAPEEERRATRNWFIRGLAVIYFCAFASLWIQVVGLAGAHGILPVGDYLEAIDVPGFSKYFAAPTLCWLDPSDGSLLLQCALGTIVSIALFFGLSPGLLLAALWVLWLSLTVACRDFLGFQWENLLLEAGFLAIWLVPLVTPLQKAPPPRKAVVWLFWWLLFRLMFLSGVVKLQSGDPAWRNFTALFYHFETQPLPTVFGWYAYQWPSKLLVAETGIMYLIELVIPLLIFVGRRARLVAALSFVLLQAGIAITGNYCYFNFLTALLCVLLLDDEVLLTAGPGKRRLAQETLVSDAAHPLSTRTSPSDKIQLAILGLVTFLFGISVMQTSLAFGLVSLWPRPILAGLQLIESFRSVNNYGLFAVMTQTRREIIIEGSNDGVNWLAYDFRYKPGNPKQRPRFAAPHQPRLDWQMWFAALSTYEQNPWFVNVCVRLLQGERSVLGLLARNPFPKAPPKFLRAELYNYEFTSRAQLRETGDWWQREHLHTYFGPISLRTNRTDSP